MGAISDSVTQWSSVLLRLSAYSFLRWIPGHHLPPIIYTLTAVYLVTFYRSFTTTEPYQILSDEIEVAVKETAAQAEDAEEDEDESSEKNVPNGGFAVSEVAVSRTRGAQPWRTLLSGQPSPSSSLLSLTTFLINLALVATVTDLVYRAPTLYEAHELSFARVGYVSDRTANIVVREPKGAQYPLYLSYRYSDSPRSEGLRETDVAWSHAGSIEWADAETDFTSALTITGLKPDTRYQYSVDNHTGYFITAPVTGRPSWRSDGKFTFLHTSCIKARFPYNPFQHPLHVPGFKHLAKWIPELQARFMLFLGDFIYIDVPHRFGIDIETYRREYRQVYASPDWPSVSTDLPWLHVIDDHEIANDWDQNTTGIYKAAADPYLHYHVAGNPPAHRKGETYFSFVQGPASFFMIDTRRYRSPSSPLPQDDPSKTMLGAQQLADLLTWLKRPTPAGVKWKIVVSSIPFTKNWRVNSADTWYGYLAERKIVLEAMWAASAATGTGIVVLSGDRHEFAATRFAPPRDSQWSQEVAVHEFSTSPLSMFYLPFRTYKQTDDEDECITYIPDGNSKFGAIEITSDPTSDQSELKYRLFIDGDETWSYRVLTPSEGGGRRRTDGIWS